MTQSDSLRNQKRRLGVLKHYEEVTRNVSKTCRYFGISRHTFYKWQRKYKAMGPEGLLDGSRRPIHSPRATKPEILGKIIYLRQTYHLGPWKIMVYLERYHDIHVSSSGIWRILKKLQMNRLPSNQRYKRHQERWKRYEKPLPGHRIQVDMKFLERTEETRKRYYQYMAIDDCTRLRVLRIYDKNNQRTAMQFIDYALSRLPFRTEVIQTDNGSEFQGQFHWHVLDKGINHVYIKPRRPRLNGKADVDDLGPGGQGRLVLTAGEAELRSARLFGEESSQLFREGGLIDPQGASWSE